MFVIPSGARDLHFLSARRNCRSPTSFGMTILKGGGGSERNARQFAAEVGGVALAVLGVVQDGVDVVEDVPLGDGGVVVVRAELFEGPVGDVLAAVGAVFVFISNLRGISLFDLLIVVGRRFRTPRQPGRPSRDCGAWSGSSCLVFCCSRASATNKQRSTLAHGHLCSRGAGAKNSRGQR